MTAFVNKATASFVPFAAATSDSKICVLLPVSELSGRNCQTFVLHFQNKSLWDGHFNIKCFHICRIHFGWDKWPRFTIGPLMSAHGSVAHFSLNPSRRLWILSNTGGVFWIFECWIGTKGTCAKNIHIYQYRQSLNLTPNQSLHLLAFLKHLLQPCCQGNDLEAVVRRGFGRVAHGDAVVAFACWTHAFPVAGAWLIELHGRTVL